MENPFTYANKVLTQPVMVLIGAISAIVVHNGFFISGEWHVQAPSLVWIHFTAFAWLSILFRNGIWLCGSYITTLFTSMIIYRLFFHRLSKAHFNGPRLASVSKLWHVWKVRGSQNHHVLDALNKEYGDFVRTGPSEVTIFDPSVFAAIDGPQTGCVKSEFYDLLHPSIALVTAREKEAHGVRRREWNRAFTAKALSSHEDKMMKYIDQLDNCIDRNVKQNKVSDMRSLLYWFGFDAMGDFVLSDPFNMLQNEEWHHILERGRNAMSLLGPLGPAAWLIQIAFKMLPRVWVLKDWFLMTEWAEQQMKKRLAKSEDTLEKPDVAYWLLKDVKKDMVQNGTWAWLSGDSLLAIVAGSEPIASALIGLFYELALHPDQAEKINTEVCNIDIRDARVLAQASHLNACIDEALRLFPALPTGGNRNTQAQGITIAGRYIPPYTTIAAPRYTISRREDCFERGREFVPERWTTKPEMVRNKAAFTPFGTGSHSCLGRYLSTDQMRLVTARLVTKYRFKLAPGGGQVESGFKDQFAAKPGPLSLVFELRDQPTHG